MKRYDRAYFDKWYRNPRTMIRSNAELRRKIAMVVAVAEVVLDRRIRSVLDVGCGEARWYTELKKIRPNVRYIGLDTSEYSVEKFGSSRNVRYGSFEGLESQRLRGGFDVVVCADVLHYLELEQIKEGLPELVRLVRGAAYLDLAVREDEPEGDLRAWKDRPATWYRSLFVRHGLVDLGMQCWGASEAKIYRCAMELRRT